MGAFDTYRLADFIPFGAQHNAAYFPAPLVGLLLGVGLLFAVIRGRGRLAGGLLAVAWVWLGAAWYAGSYADLNWAGGRMAWLAFAQAALLALMAWRGLGAQRSGWGHRVGLALLVGGLVVFPLLDPLVGRPWAGVEVFGHAPEPTALVTMGTVLAIGRLRPLGLLLPTAACLGGAATASVLETAGWWVPLAAVGVAWLALVDRR